MDLLVVLTRTLFFYFFILISYRIMGKREIGQLQVSDLSISILIAELVAISIENRDESVMFTLLPILLLVILEIVLALLELKYNKARITLDGKPSIIINSGKLNIKEMIKQRYSLDDLLLSLRSNSINSISDVSFAILETNGKLSVFRKNNNDYPFPLIIDGVLDQETLININKNIMWLNKLLKNNNMEIKDIMYAFYKENKLYYIRK